MALYIFLFFKFTCSIIVDCGQDCLSCTGIETAGDCDRRETCNNDEVLGTFEHEDK